MLRDFLRVRLLQQEEDLAEKHINYLLRHLINGDQGDIITQRMGKQPPLECTICGSQFKQLP